MMGVMTLEMTDKQEANVAASRRVEPTLIRLFLMPPMVTGVTKQMPALRTTCK